MRLFWLRGVCFCVRVGWTLCATTPLYEMVSQQCSGIIRQYMHVHVNCMRHEDRALYMHVYMYNNASSIK